MFEGLKIAQEKELCEKYMGKFPVISISLKSVDGLNYEAAVAALRGLLGTWQVILAFWLKAENLARMTKNYIWG